MAFWWLSDKRYRSHLLQFLGKYSYEIFLLHGAFLVKYNPIIKNPEILPVTGEFAVYLAFVFTLAVGLSVASAGIRIKVTALRTVTSRIGNSG